MEKSQTTSQSPAKKQLWGGQLEAQRDYSAPTWSSPEMVPLMLRKFCELCLLATVIAVPLTFHFYFKGNWYARLAEFFGSSEFFLDQVEPFITVGMPILETKFTAWFLLGSLMIGGFILARLYEILNGVSVFHGIAEPERGSAELRRPHRKIVFWAGLGFLLFSAFSILFWPPKVPPESLETIRESNRYTLLGGGGFFYSILALCQAVFGFVFYLVAEDIFRTRRLVSKTLGILVAVGLLNALVVVLVQADFPPLTKFWIPVDLAGHRNNFGGFIGHNTGMSGFLMTPIFVCTTWLMLRRRRGGRFMKWLLGGSILLMVQALLLAQSRAVIPIAIVGAVVLLILAARRCGLKPAFSFYVVVPLLALFLLFFQTVPFPNNPLYRKDITLLERAEHLSPRHLLSETRLRIAVVSSGLVAESPLIGHGFATFQYVYPKAQGEYYTEHPQSNIAPTDKRTQRAHNEFLQLLVETGVIGLGVILYALFIMLKGGLRVLDATLLQRHIALQLALAVSIAAMLLHCFLDFSLRVPPLALTIVLLLAIWSAGDRLWVFPVAPLEPDEEPIAGTGQQEEPARRRPAEFIRAVGWIDAGLIVAAAFVVISVLFIVRFEALGLTTMRAQQNLEEMRITANDSRRQYLFMQIKRDLRDAMRIAILDGRYNRGMAYLNTFISRWHFDDARDAEAAGRTEVAENYRSLGLTNAHAAINNLNFSLKEERFHSQYQLRSAVYNIMARNVTDQSEANRYWAKSFEDLATAVTFNPGAADAALQLIRMLDNMDRKESPEILRLMGMIAHFHPEFFRRNVLSDVTDALALDKGEEAYWRMERIAAATDELPDLPLFRSFAALSAGRLEEARDHASQYYQAHQRDPYAILNMVRVAAAMGNYESAISFLERLPETDINEAQIQALRTFLYELSGRSAQKERAELERIAANDPLSLQVIGTIAWNVFRDAEEAAKWLERRLAIEEVENREVPVDLQILVISAKVFAELGEWDRVADLIFRIREFVRREEFMEYREQFSTPFAQQLAWEISFELENRMREATGKTLDEMLAEETVGESQDAGEAP